jgi:anti-sigma factor RsiW
MNCQEANPLLNPYLDGELDLVTAVRVEEHIAACAGCGREYRDLHDLRREIADARLDYLPKPEFVRRVAAARRRTRPGVQAWWKRPEAWMAAAAAVLILVFVPARLLRTGTADTREVLQSHLRSLMATHLVDVPSSDHHTVKPWFQGRLSFSPDVPDLSNQGFVLTGGRLEMVRGAPAAAIVYKRRDHVINLFVASTGEKDSPPRPERIEGYNLALWVKGGLSYWAVSDLNAGELMQFAESARSR